MRKTLLGALTALFSFTALAADMPVGNLPYTNTMSGTSTFITAHGTGTNKPVRQITYDDLVTALRSAIATGITNGQTGVVLNGTFTGNGNGLSNIAGSAVIGRIPSSALPLGTVTNSGTYSNAAVIGGTLYSSLGIPVLGFGADGLLYDSAGQGSLSSYSKTLWGDWRLGAIYGVPVGEEKRLVTQDMLTESGNPLVTDGELTVVSNALSSRITALYYNPVDYGAIAGDGLDDTAAFRSAAAAMELTGGIFTIPEGQFDFMLTNTVGVTFRGLTAPLATFGSYGGYEVRGSGKTVLTVHGGGETNQLFRFEQPRMVWIHDFQVTAAGSATTNTTGIVLVGPSGSGLTIERVLFNKQHIGIYANDMTDVTVRDVTAFDCFIGLATANSCDAWDVSIRSQYGAYAAVFGHTNAIFPGTIPGINCDNMQIRYLGDRSYATNAGWPNAQIWIRGSGLYTIHDSYTEANASGATTPVIMVGEEAGGMKWGGTAAVNLVNNEHTSKTAGNVWLFASAIVRISGGSGWDGTRVHDSVVFKNSTAQTGSYVESDGSGRLQFTDGASQVGAFNYNAAGVYNGLGDGFQSAGGILSATRGALVEGQVIADFGATHTANNLARTNHQSGVRLSVSNGVPTLAPYGGAKILGATPGADVITNNYAGNFVLAPYSTIRSGLNGFSETNFFGNASGMNNIPGPQIVGTVPNGALNGTTHTNVTLTGGPQTFQMAFAGVSGSVLDGGVIGTVGVGAPAVYRHDGQYDGTYFTGLGVPGYKTNIYTVYLTFTNTSSTTFSLDIRGVNPGTSVTTVPTVLTGTATGFSTLTNQVALNLTNINPSGFTDVFETVRLINTSVYTSSVWVYGIKKTCLP